MAGTPAASPKAEATAEAEPEVAVDDSSVSKKRVRNKDYWKRRKALAKASKEGKGGGEEK
jgi:hypothetical protein